jgi:cobalamin biosynthesis protein CbiG
MHLPIFAEQPPNDAAVAEAAALIREESKDLLRNPEELVERIEAPVTIEEDDEDDGENEDVEVDRAQESNC